MRSRSLPVEIYKCDVPAFAHPSRSLAYLGGAGDTVASSKHTSVVNAYGSSECPVSCTINNIIGALKLYMNIGKGVGSLTWITDLPHRGGLCWQ